MTLVSTSEIDRWSIGRKQILLFRENDGSSSSLIYNIMGKDRSRHVKIPSHLYSNIHRTCGIVLLFHDVIETNLRHSIEPSSFVPVLESYAWTKRFGEYVPLEHLKVALFGHGDSNTKTVHGAHWGIFNELDNSTKIFDVQKIEGDLQECLVNVLCNRYYVSFYADHRIEVFLDSDGQLQFLALTILSRPSFYSIFDTSVSLDENHWAVTLVSTKQNFTRGRISSGHAVIACEGGNEARQFVEYVHITKKPEKGDTNKSLSGARVEIVKEVSFIERKGPTWRRARSAVENILVLAQKAQQDRQILPFALGKNIYKMAFPVASFCLVVASIVAARYDYRMILAFHSHFYFKGSLISFTLHRILSMSQAVRSFLWSFGFNIRYGFKKSVERAAASLITASIGGAGMYVSKKLSDRYDCLSWSIEQLSEAGIHIRLPLSIVTPNGAIEYLNLHVKVIVLEDS